MVRRDIHVRCSYGTQNAPGLHEQVERGVGHVQAQVHVAEVQVGVDHGLQLQGGAQLLLGVAKQPCA